MFALLLTLLSCNKQPESSIDEIRKLRFRSDVSRRDSTRTMRLEVVWKPYAFGPNGQGCPPIWDTTIKLDNLLFHEGTFGGGGSSVRWNCLSSIEMPMPRADAPDQSGDHEVTFRVHDETLVMVMDAPFRLRHLTPTEPIDTVLTGQQIALTLEGDEQYPLHPSTVFLARVDEDRGHPRVTPTIKTTGDTILINIPTDILPGQWRLFARADANVVTSCPVEECASLAPARLSRVITIKRPELP